MDEDDEELARLLPPTSRHNSPARPHTATPVKKTPARSQPFIVIKHRQYLEHMNNVSSPQHNTRRSYSTVQEFGSDEIVDNHEKLSNLACHTKHKKFVGERIR